MLHDNTVYKLPNSLFTLRIEKKIKFERDKELIDLNNRYIKARNLYKSNKKNKISINHKAAGSISTDYEKYIQKKNR